MESCLVVEVRNWCQKLEPLVKVRVRGRAEDHGSGARQESRNQERRRIWNEEGRNQKQDRRQGSGASK